MLLGQNACVGDKYRLEFRVGQGKAGGAVYGARDVKDREGQRVAVKYPVRPGELEVLIALSSKTEDSQEKARASAVPCMPRLLDWGEHQQKPYAVTALLGSPISAVFKKLKGPLETNWCALCALGRMVIRRLRIVHQCGYVHCDVQPGNILLGARLPEGNDVQPPRPQVIPAPASVGEAAPPEYPYLIDFGCARPFPGSGRVRADWGSVDFASIHSATGGERNPYDDLEALGWVLCHGLFGDLPWFACTREAVWTDGKLSDADRPVVCKQVSNTKAALLAGKIDAFGPAWAHLQDMPQELVKFLQLCSARGGENREVPDYDACAGTLGGSVATSSDAAEQWDMAQFQECLALAESDRSLPPSIREVWRREPEQTVSVFVKHAQIEDSSITVDVLNTGKVIDVRQAVLAALGEKRLSAVKLVRQQGQDGSSGSYFISLGDGEKVGDRREFLSLGRSLTAD